MKLFLLSLLCLGSLTTASRYVAYIDDLTGWWDTSILEAMGVPGYTKKPHPYNVLILSFYLSNGNAADALTYFFFFNYYLFDNNNRQNFNTDTQKKICNCSNPTADSFRQGLLNIYHSHGIKLLMSCFGSTDFPTSSVNAHTLGNNIATY
ncbi:hypothetical protein RFI_06841, partial [Reticulomyxa filosa]